MDASKNPAGDKAITSVEKSLVIAMDGPAASGKSTIGNMVAQELGYVFFDTGAMYRAVTLAGLQRGVELTAEEDVAALAYRLDIEVTAPQISDGRQYTVIVDGIDVTWLLRGADVDANVSVVSAYPGVRSALTVHQRRIASLGRIVMVGRDIGTVVYPEAGLKIYLDASAEERARRRLEEIQSRGGQAEFETILAGVRGRDHIDSNRKTAPLRIPDDAIIVNTDGMGIEEVVATVLELVTDCLASNTGG